jgi:hypothetical protein
MLMEALKAWRNPDHEGDVMPGRRFEANEYRARELVRAGLAFAVMSDTQKIRVVADPPQSRSKSKARA